MDSDHALVIARYRIKLQRIRKNRNSHPRYETPTEETKRAFREKVLQHCATQAGDTPPFTTLTNAFREGAKILTPKPREARKEWISQHTWTLMEQRAEARLQAEPLEETRLNRLIKKSARLDKKRFWCERFEESDHPKQKWKYIKLARKTYEPRFLGIKNVDGTRAIRGTEAEAVRNYLEGQHWAAPIGPGPPPRDAPLRNPLPIDTGPFTPQEIRTVIAKLKTNRAPGPDGITQEMYSWLEADAAETLAPILFELVIRPDLPEEFAQARVVAIYKKGDYSLASNYRPISLLNTCFKIVASVIKHRITPHCEPHLTPTQYGFRQHRGTSEALHIARRIIERSEQFPVPAHLLFLDWEKAFDRIDKHRMFEALKRFGLPDAIVGWIQALYKHGIFTVAFEGHESSRASQQTGIKQGCPLSPYLF